MTIPRIGDKIKKTQATGTGEKISNAQNLEQTIQNTPEPDNKTTDQKDTDAVQDKQTQQDNTPAPTAAPKLQKEYSIEQFTKDFNDIFHNKVLNMLKPYEEIRKSTLLKASISSGILIGLAVLYVIAPIPQEFSSGDITWGLIGGGIAVWLWFKKQFELKLKRKVMPILMKAVPDFQWREPFDLSKLPSLERIVIGFAPKGKTAKKYMLKAPIPTEEISAAMMFPYDDKCIKTFDDCFTGKYRGVDIIISECDYSLNNKNRSNVFSGAIVRLKMNKNFDGLTVLRPKKNIKIKNIKDLKKAGLQKVELEDININKTYDIYSTDQIEARYLLTTGFVDRFQHITTAFKSKVSFCSFYGNYVYIAPYCEKDLFSLGNLKKPVTDEEQYRVMFEEFVSVLALVDHFKLDKKLGL